jgi:hypothetical protein
MLQKCNVCNKAQPAFYNGTGFGVELFAAMQCLACAKKARFCRSLQAKRDEIIRRVSVLQLVAMTEK